MLRNKQSHRHHYAVDVTHCIICIPNYDDVEYLNGEELQKFYQRSYHVNLSDLCNAIKKILDKTTCHNHFKFTLDKSSQTSDKITNIAS